jgi:hypothetical protein
MFARSLRRGAVAVAAVLLAAGCTRDAPLEPDEPVVGSYSLTAVGGQGLPVTFQGDNQTQEVLSGTLELTATMTFTEVITVRTTPAGGEPTTADNEIVGTYSVSGRTVTFNAEDGSWQGTASNGVLSYIIGNVTVLFER